MSQGQTGSARLGADDGTRKDRRFRNVLLEPRFQLKYTAMIMSVAVLISVPLGVFLIGKVKENSRMLALDDAFAAELAAQDAQIIFALLIAFFVFLAVLFTLSIMVTHRMAGPLFVMRRYLRELARGGLPRIRSLRQGDEFTDLIETLIDTVDALEERTVNEIGILKRAQEALDDDDDKAERLIKELSVLIDEKEEAVDRRRMPPAKPGRGSSFLK